MDKRTVVCLLSAASAAFGTCAASEVGEYLIPAGFRGEVPPLRVMRDIPFACDLSEADGLSFDFRADDLSEFSSFSFHFGWESNTWRSASFYPTVEGRWTRMTVRRPDDASRDWSKVTGFRLSGWRGGTNATTLAVRGIAVERHRAVEKPADAEYKAACAATNAAALCMRWFRDAFYKEEGKVKKCGMLTYVKGYRDGTDEERVRLLKEALEGLKWQILWKNDETNGWI